MSLNSYSLDQFEHAADVSLLPWVLQISLAYIRGAVDTIDRGSSVFERARKASGTQSVYLPKVLWLIKKRLKRDRGGGGEGGWLEGFRPDGLWTFITFLIRKS